MTRAREVLVVEPVPELAAFYEALVRRLDPPDVRLTIELDVARGARLADEGAFDVVVRDPNAMLALVEQIMRSAAATQRAESTLRLDNRW